MISLVCKVCGGAIVKTADGFVCDSCGTPVSQMNLDDEKKIESINRANEARRTFDFDEAIRAYTQLLANNPKDAEVHWQLALSKFGIEDVPERLPDGRIQYVPTIHRLRFESFDKDENYKNAMKYADDNALGYYMTQGKKITAIQNKLMDLVRNEKDYDVFISFKAEDAEGNRSEDSLIAQEIYEQLTKNGIKTFFSRISLQNVVGEEYEPHIFSALNSSKVMILVATDLSYINYGWVKNEWTRFLDLMDQDSSNTKTLIPVYKHLPKEVLPSRIPMRESVDYSNKDALLEIVHGVSNLLGKKDLSESDTKAKMFVEKAKDALDKRDFAEVIKQATEATMLVPDLGEAWFMLFLAENRVALADELSTRVINWMDSRYFSRAYEYSRGIRKQILDEVKNRYALEQENLRNNEQARKAAELAKERTEKDVRQAKSLMQGGRFKEAYELLSRSALCTAEVNELTNDCELGVEYERLNKLTYLETKVREINPKAYEQYKALLPKKTAKKEGLLNFGADKAYQRFFSPLLLCVAVFVLMVLYKISMNANSHMISVVITVLCMASIIVAIVYICSLCEVISRKRGGLGDSKIKYLIISFVVVTLVANLMAMNKGIFVVVIIAMAAMTALGYNDFKNLNIKQMTKAMAFYKEKIEPIEDELIDEYNRKYNRLAMYTALAELQRLG